MTYIRVRTGRRLSTEVANALRDDIVDLLYMVRKSPSTCMIDIDTGCNIRMGDGGEPCVFVDMRFAVMPEDEELRAFSVELAGLFADALGVDVNKMYFNFGTMPYCATGSVLAPEQR